ncbi:unnamed protein product [Phytophthora fragariaefolia]|uniref:Unnamed protein product n=1 Tax=Phytophthora fragariaefolia TaxID=1490495 RepID=A0A9W6XK97_9STRA|nr:unnamed protein product [Phytophthora fragariaefolia]
MPLLGPEGVSHLASQGLDAVNARLEAFSSYEKALLEHLQQRMTAVTASATPMTTSTSGPKPKPLMVSVKTFEGKEGESLLLGNRELEMAMAMGSALLKTEQQRVALATSKLGGRAREWARTCGTSVETSFPTWEQLKQQLSRVFAPPNQAYRVRSRFLATRQGKKLVDYVQDLRTLIAGMAVDPLPGAVTVTVIMEGLRTGMARPEVFRTHPASFEEAVNVALNAEFNFKSSRLGWNASFANPSSGPEPMASAALRMKKLSFLLRSSVEASGDALYVATRATYGPVALCVTAARLLRAKALLRARTLGRFWKTRSRSRRGAAYWGITKFF